MSTTNPMFDVSFGERLWQYGWESFLILIVIILLWFFYVKDGAFWKKRNDAGMKRNAQLEFDKNVEQYKKEGEYICEWCGMSYPPGGYYYKKISVRNMNVLHSNLVEHIICKDCYVQLEDK